MSKGGLLIKTLAISYLYGILKIIFCMAAVWDYVYFYSVFVRASEIGLSGPYVHTSNGLTH